MKKFSTWCIVWSMRKSKYLNLVTLNVAIAFVVFWVAVLFITYLIHSNLHLFYK